VNTFTLNARVVSAWVARIMRFAPSGFSAPKPIDPSAPAFDTAAANAGVDTPAMGAWMMG